MGMSGVMRIIGALALAVSVSACASPGKGFLVPLDKAAQVSHTRTIIAVTTRTPADDPEKGEIFAGGRAPDVHVMALTLSMPPGRAAGAIPTSTDKPDPAKHIALVSARPMSWAEFGALLKTPSFKGRRALVFTHGFNTQFDDSVVRFAQIVEDTDFKGIPVLFSWPSRGGVTDYGYDKDSANFSRDALESLLVRLSREPNVAGVDMFAHSMGNWLTLETFRQIAIAKDQKTLDSIKQVVLAAPDVDMDVFRTQVGRLGALRSRITLYASKDDHALQLSRRLFGGQMRAGENTNIKQFSDLGIAAHDLSDVKGGVGRNHGKAFNDGATIESIGRSMSSGSPARQVTDPITSGLAELGRGITRAATALQPPAR
jgi:esterase/lipase superfamily enzyme